MKIKVQILLKILQKKISFENIKSNYILKKVFNFLREKKLLDIVHYNKYLQKKLNKDINDFKEFLKIEIEIITSDDKKFINYAEESKEYYHIYFNEEKYEKKKKFFNKS
jgi:hypothetical protein